MCKRGKREAGREGGEGERWGGGIEEGGSRGWERRGRRAEEVEEERGGREERRRWRVRGERERCK